MKSFCLKYSKKGISPLIAGVILVAITIAVSSIVVNFMEGYTQDITTDVSSQSKSLLSCRMEQPSITSVSVSGKYQISNFSGKDYIDIDVSASRANDSLVLELAEDANILYATVNITSAYNLSSKKDSFSYLVYDNNSGVTPNAGPSRLGNSSANILWSKEYSNDYISSTPAVKDGVVYIVKYSSWALVALDEHTGENIWNYTLSFYSETSPIVVDNVVYISDRKGNFSAIYTNGTLKWNNDIYYNQISPYYGSSFIYKEGILYIAGGNTIMALYAENGSQAWNITDSSLWIYGKPALSGDKIIVVSEGGGFLWASYDINTRQRAANASHYLYGWGSPVVANGIVFATDEDDGVVSASYLSNGSHIWDASALFSQGENTYNTNPVFYEGYIYIATDKSNIFKLNAQNGQLIWKKKITGIQQFDDAVPIISNGYLYIISKNPAILFAIDTDTEDIVSDRALGSAIGGVFTSVAVADGIVFAVSYTNYAATIYAIAQSLPDNTSLDIGSDAQDDYTNVTGFSFKSYLNLDIKSALSSYLSSCTGYCKAPLKFSSLGDGTVRLKDINISYMKPAKVTLKNAGKDTIGVSKVMVYSKSGEECIISGNATELSGGETKTFESSACAIQCADFDYAVATTLCATQTKYIKAASCT